ncbi:pirin family protein [Legionella hackeliae]|nr:pirin family protein [Legionella hackeliae]
MIVIRNGSARGHTKIDWLNSFHTFSFGGYYEPEFMGFSCLRVINEDTVKPGKGFGRHPHKDMEIISYVVKGSLEHKDSMGTGSIIRPGEIQCMSAGTGVEHSEFNHSFKKSVHFLQIWILPEKKNLKPTYQQKAIPQLHNELLLIGSKENLNNMIKINQDVKIFSAHLFTSHSIHYEFINNRCGWLQLISGRLILNDYQVYPGDGVAILNKDINISSLDDAEFLLFDLPSLVD